MLELAAAAATAAATAAAAAAPPPPEGVSAEAHAAAVAGGYALDVATGVYYSAASELFNRSKYNVHMRWTLRLASITLRRADIIYVNLGIHIHRASVNTIDAYNTQASGLCFDAARHIHLDIIQCT